MKNIFKLALGLTLATAFAAACQTEESVGGFSIDINEITVGSEGGTELINVTSGVEWTASSRVPWISISPANGVGSTPCTVSIDTTLIVGMREGTITFVPVGRAEETVNVYQTGYGNIISLSESEIEIPASANYSTRYFEVQVTTNVEFTMDVEYLRNTEPDNDGEYRTPTGWVTVPSVDIKFDRGARPRTATLKFDWKTNTDWVPRAAKITFTPSGENEGAELVSEALISLSQDAAEEITDDARGDSLAILSIRDQLNMMSEIDASEKLTNWDGVTLWEKTDKDLPVDENGNAITDAIGRVRSVQFQFFNCSETIPESVKFLKYCESLMFFSNTNSMLKSIDLGSEVCELKYLKSLQIGAYGLVSLPDDFYKLENLESLDISSNNFDHIPEVLTRENFPNLRVFHMTGNRRWSMSDLRNAGNYDDGIGLFINMQSSAAAEGIRRLFFWDELEEVTLSYNYLEGNIPDFRPGDIWDGREITPYREGEDLVELRDTVAWLWTEEGQQIARILPNCKTLHINLNFLTGSVPDWIMYHPYLIDWVPDTFIFNQNEDAHDSAGNVVQFNNAPGSYTYYYEKYPLYEQKYSVSDE